LASRLREEKDGENPLRRSALPLGRSGGEVVVVLRGGGEERPAIIRRKGGGENSEKALLRGKTRCKGSDLPHVGKGLAKRGEASSGRHLSKERALEKKFSGP